MATKSSKTTKPSEQQVDIADHKVAWRWMKELARRDPEGFARLTGGNRKRLESLYGPPQWTQDGKHGWTAAWSVHDSGLTWIILTGQDQTIFRLRVPNDVEDYLVEPRVGVGIINYLQTLLRRLMGDN